MPAETTYFVGNSRAITNAHAVRTAENSIPYLLPYLDRLASTNPAFTLLDVGCGPGSITLSLAARYSHARVTGIDGSAAAIAQANEALTLAHSSSANAQGRCSFAVGDALLLVENNHTDYDVVLAHQVLQHVSSPLAALTSMKRAAKSNGGIVTARTMDWGLMGWCPPNEGLALQQRVYIDLMHAMGQDGCLGRRVHVLAKQAGWSLEEIEIGTDGDWTYYKPEHRRASAELMVARYTDQGEFANKLRETGIVAERGVEATLEVIREGYRAWVEDEDAWMVMPCPWIMCTNGAGRSDDA